jgi:hypothetical protein
VKVTWMISHQLVANMISKIEIGAGSYRHFIRFIVEGEWLFLHLVDFKLVMIF